MIPTGRTAPVRRERGSAVVAAVIASACFAMLATQAARTSRSAVASVNAGVVHARLAAAADAGLALAVDALAADPSVRWRLDGEAHLEDVADARLTITVEDERGKVPLNVATEAQAHALFLDAGADPAAVDALVRAFMDWRDPNRRRGQGSDEAPDTDAAPNPGGGFRTIQELALLPGMTAELYAAMAPFVTVSSGDTAFEPRTAGRLALEVMGQADVDSPEMIEKSWELSGQRTALDTLPAIDPVGRALTVRVVADDGRGGHLEQASVVELTGQAGRPFVVRSRAG